MRSKNLRLFSPHSWLWFHLLCPVTLSTQTYDSEYDPRPVLVRLQLVSCRQTKTEGRQSFILWPAFKRARLVSLHIMWMITKYFGIEYTLQGSWSAEVEGYGQFWRLLALKYCCVRDSRNRRRLRLLRCHLGPSANYSLQLNMWNLAKCIPCIFF